MDINENINYETFINEATKYINNKPDISLNDCSFSHNSRYFYLNYRHQGSLDSSLNFTIVMDRQTNVITFSEDISSFTVSYKNFADLHADKPITSDYTAYGTNPELDKLVDSADYNDRISAANQSYGLDMLVNDTDWGIKTLVAANCNGNKDILTKLCSDNEWNVRAAVAKYSQGNPDILNRLVSDTSETVRAAVAANCKGNMDILNRLVNDDDKWVRSAVAESCFGNIDILNILVNDNSEWVRKSVADYCLGNPYILNKLVNDEDADVRRAVAESIMIPDTDSEEKNICINILDTLSKDPDWNVRKAVADNCEGNKDILERLIRDTDYEVKDSAVREYHHKISEKETNFRIEPTNNNTFIVRSDSERFGNDEIVYEHHNRNKCVDYISDRRMPTKYVGAYIIPDMKTWTIRDSNSQMTPVEHYKSLDEAILRANHLLAENDYSDNTINPNSNMPYTRLVIGVEDFGQKCPVDVIHLVAGNKHLVDDCLRRMDISTDQSFLDAIEKISRGIGGVDYVAVSKGNQVNIHNASTYNNLCFPPIRICSDKSIEEAKNIKNASKENILVERE